MARHHKRTKSRRPRRQEARRILVVTEGRATEPQYVERLNSHLRSRNVTASVRTVGVGKDPLRVVQKCIEIREKEAAKQKGFDSSVCLVDVDEHASLPQAIKLADDEGIMILVSNVKFEIWLYWHVENKRPKLSAKQLDELMAKHGLAQKKALATSFTFENVDSACETARAADPDLSSGRIGPVSSSALPLLVRLLAPE